MSDAELFRWVLWIALGMVGLGLFDELNTMPRPRGRKRTGSWTQTEAKGEKPGEKPKKP